MQYEAAIGVDVGNLGNVDNVLWDLVVSESNVVDGEHSIAAKDGPAMRDLVLQAKVCFGKEGDRIGARFHGVAATNIAKRRGHGCSAVATSEVEAILDVIVVHAEFWSDEELRPASNAPLEQAPYLRTEQIVSGRIAHVNFVQSAISAPGTALIERGENKIFVELEVP